MAIAGYLKDAKNQQSNLATNLIAKGVTASATEKYDSLVSKVAQIEELRGEERTLDMLTKYNDTPESIVSIEYPESKNLFDVGNVEDYEYPIAASSTVNLSIENNNIKGSTATAYEPYGKKIDLQLSSKNLLNADNITPVQYTKIVSQGYGACVVKLLQTESPSTPIVSLCKNHLPAGTYYFTAKLKIENTLGSARDNEVLIFVNRVFKTLWSSAHSGDGEYNVSISFKIDDYADIGISFYPTVGSVALSAEYQATFTDMQLEYGNATSYTPYISDFSSANVTACGKNLIPYPYTETTKTINGITFTDNGDGTITANGTATANVNYELQHDNAMFSLPAGNYFLSGCPAGGSMTTYFMVTANGAGISYDKFIRDFGNGVTVSSKGEKWKVSIRIMSGTTVNNLVFKPQLELGSTATAYEPYQAPTIYTPTSDGMVTGIQNIYPTTNILTDNAGVLITAYQETVGNEYFDILPSEGKNGITKVHQAIVDSSVDSNIKAENIKKDVSILGVTGTLEPETTVTEPDYTYDSASATVYLIMK